MDRRRSDGLCQAMLGSRPMNAEANAFMEGPHFGANPIGVEYDPDEWLARLRAGAPPSDFLLRQTDLPVSPIRGSMQR